MSMTPDERRKRNAEINRLRYHNDPAYRAKQRAYIKAWHRGQQTAKRFLSEKERDVRLLPDETVWFGMLAGEKYQDDPRAVMSEGKWTGHPAEQLTANSSMAWAG
jgi:hypothetical protein